MTKIDFQTDPNTRDLVFVFDERGRADVKPITGAARIAQSLGIRFRCWMGEWYLDETHGVPYVDSVLGKQSQALVYSVFRTQALSVDGVNRITNLELSTDPQTRALTVDLQASTEEGLAEAKLTINS